MKIESLKSLRLRGMGKFIHNFFMFLTYPFRHAFKFLGLLLVGIVIFAAIPMSQGISYKHVLDWYLFRYNQIETKVNFRKIEKPEAVERQVKKEFRKEFKFKETAAPDRKHISAELKKKMETDMSDDIEAKTSKRKILKIKNLPFRRANINNRANIDTAKKSLDGIQQEEVLSKNINSADEKQSVLLTQPLQVKTSPVIPHKEEVVVAMPEIKNEISYRKIEALPLIYKDVTEYIEGLALVFGANDLSVGDKYVILYGIYTDKHRYDVEKATIYLQELVDKKKVECEIVAYTYDNYPTAICFLDGKSINQHLVDAGFADNIAL